MRRRLPLSLLTLFALNAHACMIWPGLTGLTTIHHSPNTSEGSTMLFALLGSAAAGASAGDPPCLGQGYCSIFVTSTPWTPGAGVASADAVCEAEKVSRTPPATQSSAYKAVLMTENGVRSIVSGTWVLHPGMEYHASSNTDFPGVTIGVTDSTGSLPMTLLNSIGGSYAVAVWTGVDSSSSTWAPYPATTCDSWASSQASNNGETGFSNGLPDGFSAYVRTCDTNAFLYCAQQ